jgi:PST family polysaccharide transporter
VKNLKEKTIRGGFARLCAQAANFVLRLGSLMVLARLLTPKDFGLVGMVTAFTGVLTLFRDFGLSSAAIQRPTVTQEQLSTLFWINLLVGAVLAVLSVALAPFIAVFYHEPRLIGITDVLALGFLFNAAGVQHSALLQREMRFTAMAVINTVGLIIGTAIAIGGARAGVGYWALVVMTVTMPLISTVGFWLATAWIPGAPRRRSGIRSMVHFGGAITLNGLVAYIATNCDKILLGRFWGVDALGMYGRAYQLVNIPTDNLNQAAGEVAFSALSRLQDDPQRLRNYFLKGYSLVLALTVPITVACALFANDITLVLLGPKWIAGAPILRLLAPTILVFAIANPLFWLLTSLGLVKRSLKMSFVLAPVMVGSYLIGLPYGPQGVAFAYSAGMMIWILPLIIWAVRGTTVSVRDILLTVFRPLASSIVAAVVAFGVHSLCGQLLPPFARLAFESVALFVTFALMLLFATGQKTLYLDLLRGLKGSSDVASVSTLEKSEVL